MSDFISSPIEVVKVGEPLSNSDEISTAVEKGEIYKRGFEDARQRYERPKGKWIIDGHHIRCNRCKEYICNTDREGNEIPNNFCPNCGARMEAENE